jgi:arylsulfatase
MVGKWHVTPPKNKDNWPLQRGFDRFYGTIHGAGSFFDPNTLTRDNTFISPYADPEYKPEEYYYTDALGDQAARFIAEHKKDHTDQPFFMYAAFTAAHWPMHALDQDIAKYKGKYDGGYGPVRQARYEQMKKLGVIQDDWKLSEQAEGWDAVKDKAWEARCMEVYAAMIDALDRNVGRIVEQLRKDGQLDNTLIFFLQDNGGCAEPFGRGANGKPRAEKPTLPPLASDYLQPDMVPKQTRDGYPVRQGQGVMPGGADTFIGYGRGWANVSNTPFREYKHWVHEGGISTPLIVHWPAGFKARNELRHTPGHLIDLMATCVDVSGAKYPAEVNGQKIKPAEGLSLRPVFDNQPLAPRQIFWEHERNCAVRDGKWKLVGKGVLGADGPQAARWELYDTEADRSELNNLAEKEPGRVKAMSAQFMEYAKRCDVLPLPGDGKKK